MKIKKHILLSCILNKKNCLSMSSLNKKKNKLLRHIVVLRKNVFIACLHLTFNI